MKLSDLIPHTSNWTGVPVTHVNTVARALRPAGLLSSAGNNPRGAEMTVDDKLNLFLGVCGVEIANRAAEHVRVWRRLVRYSPDSNHPFAFTKAKTVKDFFVDLITKDMNGGPLDVWLEKAPGPKAAIRHRITLDFFIDEFTFTIVVSRFVGSKADTIEVTFLQPPPGGEHDYAYGGRDEGYEAGSKLIRRLDAKNIRGWGTCLLETEEPK
jgi:hypothetical protein